MKKLLSLALAVCMLFSLNLTVLAVDLPMEGKTIIIHTNDTHGREPKGNPDAISMAGVAALKKQYEKQGATVLLLDAGDTLHGTPFATLDKGMSVVNVMNATGYDAMAPGNHEFNYGTNQLLKLRDAAEFKILSSNITVKETRLPFLERSTIIERGGKKYGIFGLSTPDTEYKSNPKYVKSLQFTNPAEAAKKQIKALKKADVDYIIAVAHLGTDVSSTYTSTKLLKEVQGIDVVIDGHSHTEIGEMVGNTMLASTGEHFNNVGIVEIDENDKMTAKLLGEVTEADAAVQSIINKTLAKQNVISSKVVANTTVTLNGERDDVRKKETNLGNLAADAIREATGADIALINGGSIRETLNAGPVTKGQVISVFPFGNYAVTKKIKGSDILSALEQSVSTYPENSGGFLQVSGISFKFDPSKAVNSRVAECLVNGKKIVPSNDYVIAINDYMAVGGDGYDMFKKYSTINEYETIEEMLGSYLAKNQGNAKTEDRIIAL